MVDGKDGALDVTITGPLAQSNVQAAAAESGAALEKAFKRKVQGAAQACQEQGIAFLPIAIDLLRAPSVLIKCILSCTLKPSPICPAGQKN